MNIEAGGAWSPGKAWKKRLEKRRLRYLLWIDMWPFTAVMVTLLIIFMVATGMTPDRGRGLDLPRALTATAQPYAIREDVMKISVSRDGNVFFRRSQARTESLPQLIRQALKDGAEKKVYLAVDARARYSDVEPVLDQVRSAGVQRICILTEKPSR